MCGGKSTYLVVCTVSYVGRKKTLVCIGVCWGSGCEDGGWSERLSGFNLVISFDSKASQEPLKLGLCKRE